MQWEYNWSQGYTPTEQFVGGFAPPAVVRAITPTPGVMSASHTEMIKFPTEVGRGDVGYMAATYKIERAYQSNHHDREHHKHHREHNDGHRSRHRPNTHSRHHESHESHHRQHRHDNDDNRHSHRHHSDNNATPNKLQKPKPQYQYQPQQYVVPYQQQPALQPRPQRQHEPSRSQPQPQRQHEPSRPQPQPQSQYQNMLQHPSQPKYQEPQVPPRNHLQNVLHKHLNNLTRSMCTGTKKALCIGINYTNSQNELKGCVNDAENMAKFLIQKWGFQPENIILLSDESSDKRASPTKATILTCMRWLVQNAKCHDSLFLHYSGHGGQVRDKDGDETDGYDEVIFPLDFEKNGIIVDDEMNQIMVRPLPDGCRLTALFDSCHSGSILDLLYEFNVDGSLKPSQVAPQFRALKSSLGDVISFSGCDDSGTSADTVKDGLAVGAMSYAFVKSLTANEKQTYQQLLISVRDILKKNYSQKPQLSCSHELDNNLQFIL